MAMERYFVFRCFMAMTILGCDVVECTSINLLRALPCSPHLSTLRWFAAGQHIKCSNVMGYLQGASRQPCIIPLCHWWVGRIVAAILRWLSRPSIPLEEFHFESGPSLYSGLSLEESPSQLKHVSLPLRGGECSEWVLIVMDVLVGSPGKQCGS